MRKRIVIGVCTRQRNHLLHRLLNSIWAQPVPHHYDVSVLIIDNNEKQTACEVVRGLSDKFEVTVRHESRPGLAYARNLALDTATTFDAEWFLGVDDDEWVAPDWLEQFIVGIETRDAAILVAKTHLFHDDRLSPFLHPFQWPPLEVGKMPKVFSTSNFAFHKRVFDPQFGPGLRFDHAFNESGGEDYEFMLRAKRHYGFVPEGWPVAVANEDWKGTRGTLRYRLSRKMRTQVTKHRVAALHRKRGYHGTRASNLLKLFKQTNEFVVFGTAEILWGAASFLLRRRNALHLIGTGLERWVAALAIFPFLWGKVPLAYGRYVKEDRTPEEL